MLKSLTSPFIRFLYPARCRSCSELIIQDDFLCDSCFAKIKPLVSLFVPITKKYVVTVYAAGAYRNPLRQMVLKKIYSDQLASRQLGNLMVNLIPFDVIKCDLLVPIPLHWTRYSSRGYNQAQQMAQVIGKNIGSPVCEALMRKKRTVLQARLTSIDRQSNLSDAFSLSWRYRWFNENPIKDKHVVIVDDLYTTGSTVKSAAQALIRYNPASITAVVACRAI